MQYSAAALWDPDVQAQFLLDVAEAEGGYSSHNHNRKYCGALLGCC